jgi:hypothetical protein
MVFDDEKSSSDSSDSSEKWWSGTSAGVGGKEVEESKEGLK